MDRSQVIQQIEQILAIYDQASNKEFLDKQLEELRKNLMNSKQDKIQKMLDKGNKLTFKDIQWLLDQEVTRKKIAKALKMQAADFIKYLESHNIERKRNKPKEGEKMTKAKGDLERAKSLLKETDLPCPTIANRTGVKESTVYYHSKKIRNKQNAKSEQKLTNTKPSPNMSDLAMKELKDEVTKLKGDLKEKTERIDKLLDQNVKLQKQRDELLDIVKVNDNSHELETIKKRHDLLLEYITLG